MIERMFKEPKLLQKNSNLKFSPLKNYKHSRNINAIALHHREVIEAGKHYPIFFVKEGENKFSPVAILGLEDKKNLFVNKIGEWSKGRYIPSLIRLYPFTLSKLSKNSDDSQISIAYDNQYEGLNQKDGFTIFENEKETKQGQKVIELIKNSYLLMNETQYLLHLINDLQLFKIVNIDIGENESKSKKFVLKGFYQIDIEKLNDLNNDDLLNLTKKGALHMIYNHLDSISNFTNLLNKI